MRKLYPNHSLACSQDNNLNLLEFPGAKVTPVNKDEMITNVLFRPLSRHLSEVPGALVNSVEYGGFELSWKVEMNSFVSKAPLT